MSELRSEMLGALEVTDRNAPRQIAEDAVTTRMPRASPALHAAATLMLPPRAPPAITRVRPPPTLFSRMRAGLAELVKLRRR
jgi:hypothetical protein